MFVTGKFCTSFGNLTLFVRGSARYCPQKELKGPFRSSLPYCDKSFADPRELGERNSIRGSCKSLFLLRCTGRYYYAEVFLGTPPKRFELILDTGSTISYVPCASCGNSCGQHQVYYDILYHPYLSCEDFLDQYVGDDFTLDTDDSEMFEPAQLQLR